jgi:putative ABC transport system ATP-binding protein
MNKIININSCSFKYPNTTHKIINIKSLTVNSGEHIFIKGKSGSGKSTFLNLLSGVLEAQDGDIEILGVNLKTLSSSQKDKFRADNYGIIFQELNLLPYLSVRENISLACGFSKVKAKNIQNITKEIDLLLNALEFPVAKKDVKAMDLSVGEQQRVAVARALIGKPKIIIADEPTSALDSDTKDKFMRLLFTQVEAQGATLIFVSHDKELTKYFDCVYDFAQINRAEK